MSLEIAVVDGRSTCDITANATEKNLVVARSLYYSRHIAVADFCLVSLISNSPRYGSRPSLRLDVAINQGKVLHCAIHISEKLVAQANNGMAVAVKMPFERLFFVETYAVVHNSGHIDVSTQSEILVLQVISSIYVRFQCR